MKRNLSGMFFHGLNPETGQREPYCFEELPRERQQQILDGKNPEFVKSLALQLADTLREVGEQFNIACE
jgi:hypothetical protein